MARQNANRVDSTEEIGWEQLELLCTSEAQRRYEQLRPPPRM